MKEVLKDTFRSFCVIAGVCFSTIVMASNAGAIPILYTYEGDFFTGNQFFSGGERIEIPASEQPAGFTLLDRARISFVTDSDYWGFEDFLPIFSGDFAIGPYHGIDTWRISTALDGTILRWSIWGVMPGLDWASGGSADGSGLDNIFGASWSRGETEASAFVNYPSGSPSRWTMEVVSVPDAGSTMLLLSLASVPLFLIRRRRQ